MYYKPTEVNRYGGKCCVLPRARVCIASIVHNMQMQVVASGFGFRVAKTRSTLLLAVVFR